MRGWKPTPAHLLLLGLGLSLVVVDVRMAMAVLGAQPLAVDWSPLWAAARLPAGQAGSLYDFARITSAQAPLIGIVSGVRPFVYPPSALAIFAPFALLPVLPSYLAWTATTGAFYLAASSRLTGRWWWGLLLVPPVVLAALVGQTSFLLGGMILTGLHLLDKRPACAGIVLGVATAIKPQILLLVPLALVVAQNWRSLAYWGAGAAGMFLVSLGLFGSAAWVDWLAALPRFQAVFEDSFSLVDNAITPYALARRIGCAGWWIFVAAAAPAVAVIWAIFRRPGCTADRLVALVGGALLLAPYAMNYELTLIAPALVAGARKDIRGVAVLLVVALSVPLGLGFWGLAIAMLSLAARSLRRRSCAALLPLAT